MRRQPELSRYLALVARFGYVAPVVESPASSTCYKVNRDGRIRTRMLARPGTLAVFGRLEPHARCGAQRLQGLCRGHRVRMLSLQLIVHCAVRIDGLIQLELEPVGPGRVSVSEGPRHDNEGFVPNCT